MKRLLRISFDTLIASLMSILIFIVLGIFVDKSLINIFSICFPIQYLSCILKAIFSTGANISKQKGNTNDVMSGIVIGSFFSIIVFTLLICNIDKYLNFMNYSIDSIFMFYSIFQIFLQTILGFILTKLYYQGDNKLANKYSIIFYILNFLCILVPTLLFENKFLIVIPVLCILTIYIIYIFIKSFEKFILKFNIIKWIKYDCVELTNHIFLGIAYLFGISNTISYGENYAFALTLVALITDTQWDISDSISTVAKIDISKNNFNYKSHYKNALGLCIFLIFTVIVMFCFTFFSYTFDINIALIFLIFHILDFIICPWYKIKIYYLQLEYSTSKAITINLSSKLFRLLLSFLKTPYCTIIAQFLGSVYLLTCSQILFFRNFKVNKLGYIESKSN